eukprot:CAMPEP_0194280120 /NCGR_PEP_ID=MMETSP0169-20130528/15918_1 /TAXON_ID=218684 /ORGANISM="Corethron pennatum, Strain L29A3" /LENGTH=282 /DNA_ID=CAMNT_0039024725 /DNA_START=59 /DNA_END=907 /DNA_ORIENTATION=+
MQNFERAPLLGPFLLLVTFLLDGTRIEAFSSSGLLLSSSPTVLKKTTTTASAITTALSATTGSSSSHWMDFLKFDGATPTFDVLAKTKEYSECTTYSELEPYYDHERYVFRGSIIGPITSEDVRKTQQGFNILDAYPDLTIEKFGYTVDPENPFRCYWFERWRGTNREAIQIGPVALPKTDAFADIPTHVMSVNWTPGGKIIYGCLSSPLDRFEGNTKGQGAVFGLLQTGGLPLPVSSVGNPVLIANQKLVAPLIQQKAFSDEDDIPTWWKSKARGADANDI